MSESVITLAAVDRFSWKRVWMLARYIYPALKKQLICFPILSIVSGLTLVFAPFDITSMLGIAIFFAYALAPIGLANRDFRLTSGMLPVKASEKFVLLMGYFWIVVPILLYLPVGIIFGASHIFNPAKVHAILRVYYLGFGMLSPANMVLSQFFSTAIQVSVLLVVLKTSVNRTVKGIVTGIGVYIGFIFLTAISATLYFGCRFVKMAKEDPELEKNIMQQFQSIGDVTSDDILNDPGVLESISSVMGADTMMGHFLNNYLMCIEGASILALIVMLVLIYRRLQKSGF